MTEGSGALSTSIQLVHSAYQALAAVQRGDPTSPGIGSGGNTRSFGPMAASTNQNHHDPTHQEGARSQVVWLYVSQLLSLETTVQSEITLLYPARRPSDDEEHNTHRRTSSFSDAIALAAEAVVDESGVCVGTVISDSNPRNFKNTLWKGGRNATVNHHHVSSHRQALFSSGGGGGGSTMSPANNSISDRSPGGHRRTSALSRRRSKPFADEKMIEEQDEDVAIQRTCCIETIEEVVRLAVEHCVVAEFLLPWVAVAQWQAILASLLRHPQSTDAEEAAKVSALQMSLRQPVIQLWTMAIHMLKSYHQSGFALGGWNPTSSSTVSSEANRMAARIKAAHLFNALTLLRVILSSLHIPVVMSKDGKDSSGCVPEAPIKLPSRLPLQCRAAYLHVLPWLLWTSEEACRLPSSSSTGMVVLVTPSPRPLPVLDTPVTKMIALRIAAHLRNVTSVSSTPNPLHFSRTNGTLSIRGPLISMPLVASASCQISLAATHHTNSAIAFNYQHHCSTRWASVSALKNFIELGFRISLAESRRLLDALLASIGAHSSAMKPCWSSQTIASPIKVDEEHEWTTGEVIGYLLAFLRFGHSACSVADICTRCSNHAIHSTAADDQETSPSAWDSSEMEKEVESTHLDRLFAHESGPQSPSKGSGSSSSQKRLKEALFIPLKLLSVRAAVGEGFLARSWLRVALGMYLYLTASSSQLEAAKALYTLCQAFFAAVKVLYAEKSQEHLQGELYRVASILQGSVNLWAQRLGRDGCDVVVLNALYILLPIAGRLRSSEPYFFYTLCSAFHGVLIPRVRSTRSFPQPLLSEFLSWHHAQTMRMLQDDSATMDSEITRLADVLGEVVGWVTYFNGSVAHRQWQYIALQKTSALCACSTRMLYLTSRASSPLSPLPSTPPPSPPTSSHVVSMVTELHRQLHRLLHFPVELQSTGLFLDFLFKMMEMLGDSAEQGVLAQQQQQHQRSEAIDSLLYNLQLLSEVVFFFGCCEALFAHHPSVVGGVETNSSSGSSQVNGTLGSGGEVRTTTTFNKTALAKTLHKRLQLFSEWVREAVLVNVSLFTASVSSANVITPESSADKKVMVKMYRHFAHRAVLATLRMVKVRRVMEMDRMAVRVLLLHPSALSEQHYEQKAMVYESLTHAWQLRENVATANPSVVIDIITLALKDIECISNADILLPLAADPLSNTPFDDVAVNEWVGVHGTDTDGDLWFSLSKISHEHLQHRVQFRTIVRLGLKAVALIVEGFRLLSVLSSSPQQYMEARIGHLMKLTGRTVGTERVPTPKCPPTPQSPQATWGSRLSSFFGADAGSSLTSAPAVRMKPPKSSQGHPLSASNEDSIAVKVHDEVALMWNTMWIWHHLFVLMSSDRPGIECLQVCCMQVSPILHHLCVCWGLWSLNDHVEYTRWWLLEKESDWDATDPHRRFTPRTTSPISLSSLAGELCSDVISMCKVQGEVAQAFLTSLQQSHDGVPHRRSESTSRFAVSLQQNSFTPRDVTWVTWVLTLAQRKRLDLSVLESLPTVVKEALKFVVATGINWVDDQPSAERPSSSTSLDTSSEADGASMQGGVLDIEARDLFLSTLQQYVLLLISCATKSVVNPVRLASHLHQLWEVVERIMLSTSSSVALLWDTNRMNTLTNLLLLLHRCVPLVISAMEVGGGVSPRGEEVGRRRQMEIIQLIVRPLTSLLMLTPSCCGGNASAPHTSKSTLHLLQRYIQSCSTQLAGNGCDNAISHCFYRLFLFSMPLASSSASLSAPPIAGGGGAVLLHRLLAPSSAEWVKLPDDSTTTHLVALPRPDTVHHPSVAIQLAGLLTFIYRHANAREKKGDSISFVPPMPPVCGWARVGGALPEEMMAWRRLIRETVSLSMTFTAQGSLSSITRIVGPTRDGIYALSRPPPWRWLRALLLSKGTSTYHLGYCVNVSAKGRGMAVMQHPFSTSQLVDQVTSGVEDGDELSSSGMSSVSQDDRSLDDGRASLSSSNSAFPPGTPVAQLNELSGVDHTFPGPAATDGDSIAPVPSYSDSQVGSATGGGGTVGAPTHSEHSTIIRQSSVSFRSHPMPPASEGGSSAASGSSHGRTMFGCAPPLSESLTKRLPLQRCSVHTRRILIEWMEEVLTQETERNSAVSDSDGVVGAVVVSLHLMEDAPGGVVRRLLSHVLQLLLRSRIVSSRSMNGELLSGIATFSRRAALEFDADGVSDVWRKMVLSGSLTPAGVRRLVRTLDVVSGAEDTLVERHQLFTVPGNQSAVALLLLWIGGHLARQCQIAYAPSGDPSASTSTPHDSTCTYVSQSRREEWDEVVIACRTAVLNQSDRLQMGWGEALDRLRQWCLNSVTQPTVSLASSRASSVASGGEESSSPTQPQPMLGQSSQDRQVFLLSPQVISEELDSKRVHQDEEELPLPISSLSSSSRVISSSSSSVRSSRRGSRRQKSRAGSEEQQQQPNAYPSVQLLEMLENLAVLITFESSPSRGEATSAPFSIHSLPSHLPSPPCVLSSSLRDAVGLSAVLLMTQLAAREAEDDELQEGGGQEMESSRWNSNRLLDAVSQLFPYLSTQHQDVITADLYQFVLYTHHSPLLRPSSLLASSSHRQEIRTSVWWRCVQLISTRCTRLPLEQSLMLLRQMGQRITEIEKNPSNRCDPIIYAIVMPMALRCAAAVAAGEGGSTAGAEEDSVGKGLQNALKIILAHLTLPSLSLIVPPSPGDLLSQRGTITFPHLPQQLHALYARAADPEAIITSLASLSPAAAVMMEASLLNWGRLRIVYSNGGLTTPSTPPPALSLLRSFFAPVTPIVRDEDASDSQQQMLLERKEKVDEVLRMIVRALVTSSNPLRLMYFMWGDKAPLSGRGGPHHEDEAIEAAVTTSSVVAESHVAGLSRTASSQMAAAAAAAGIPLEEEEESLGQCCQRRCGTPPFALSPEVLPSWRLSLLVHLASCKVEVAHTALGRVIVESKSAASTEGSSSQPFRPMNAFSTSYTAQASPPTADSSAAPPSHRDVLSRLFVYLLHQYVVGTEESEVEVESASSPFARRLLAFLNAFIQLVGVSEGEKDGEEGSDSPHRVLLFSLILPHIRAYLVGVVFQRVPWVVSLVVKTELTSSEVLVLKENLRMAQ